MSQHSCHCNKSSNIFLTLLLLLFIGLFGINNTCHGQNTTNTCSNIATPVLIKGKKFFNKLTGKYVPLIGVNYYPRPNNGTLIQTNSIDFFNEKYRHIWERDIEYFKLLNVNVIGLYAVEPGQNHSAFMCALKAANIYVIVGLSADCENCSILKEVLPPACYPTELKQRGQFIISEFSRYDNVLAFSAGNEVSLNSLEPLSNAPCQKQFIRDMRAFIQSCKSTIRPIPVGLAYADSDRTENALYYGCRSDESDTLENAEYIGINTYQHCDGNSNELVGYEDLLTDFTNYSLPMPAVLTEFGCLSETFPTINGYAGQRNFIDVDALFSQRYRNAFVGGLVFEYSTELINSVSPFPFTTYGSGNYGLGYFTPELCDDITTPCIYNPFPQFDTLASKYGAVDVSDEPTFDTYTITDTTYPQCPAQFPPLSTFTWPSADTADMECPNFVYVTCPNEPEECSNLGIASIITNAPTFPPTDVPTKPPTIPTSNSDSTPTSTSASPTMMETKDPVAMSKSNSPTTFIKLAPTSTTSKPNGTSIPTMTTTAPSTSTSSTESTQFGHLTSYTSTTCMIILLSNIML